MTKNEWRINIENLAASVAAKHGNKVAESAFTPYNATCFDDLNPTYYWDAFGNLQQMDEDYDEDG